MKLQRFWILVIVWLLTGSVSTLGVRSATGVANPSSAPQMPRPGDKIKEIPIGTEAPDWQLKTVSGETVALSEMRGKVVVLDFWAHWCKPCRKLEPLFDQLVSEYQGKPVSFFTVSVWPSKDFDASAFMKDEKMASTFLVGDDAVARDYGLWGVPTYFVMDPAGKVSYIHLLLSVNAEALGTRLREAIERALKFTEPNWSATERHCEDAVESPRRSRRKGEA